MRTPLRLKLMFLPLAAGWCAFSQVRFSPAPDSVVVLKDPCKAGLGQLPNTVCQTLEFLRTDPTSKPWFAS